jgi:hypothetical protein
MAPTNKLKALTHSWSWALLEKLPIIQLKKFPAFYGTRRFITVFTRTLHWSLSWATSIQSILTHRISLRSSLILFTHLRLGLPSGLLPFGFPTNIPYAFLLPPSSRYMSCQSHHPWLDLCNYTWRRVQAVCLRPTWHNKYSFSPNIYTEQVDVAVSL